MAEKPHAHAADEDMNCIPCKIIIDCGAATKVAASAAQGFADASAGLRDTVMKAIEEGALDEPGEYEAAAWSQLQCNRAMHIIELTNKWAAETLAYGRKIAGVYTPALGWAVNGIEGITKAK